MTRYSTARTSLLALAGALALAGCTSKTGATNDAAANDAVAADSATDNSEAAVPPEDLTLPAGDTAVVEDASTAPPIQVVEVPAPAPSIPAADAAPLTDALAAEQLIDAGAGITRVQQADGWAWMQDGQIIRTASSDGHRVSYFRRGATTPYFVQQDDRSYSYSNGKIAHEYDDHGRPQAPDTQHQHEAQQFADQARQQHDRAQQASKTAPHIDRNRANGDHQTTDHASPPPGQPGRGAADHNAGNSDHDSKPGSSDRGNANANDHGGNASSDHGSASHNGSDRPNPRSTPTPTPVPTGHDRGHQPPSNDHKGNRDDGQSNQMSGHH